MTADVVVVLVGANDHRKRIPTDVVFNAPFDFAVAGLGNFFFLRDTVHVLRNQLQRRSHPKL